MNACTAVCRTQFEMATITHHMSLSRPTKSECVRHGASNDLPASTPVKWQQSAHISIYETQVHASGGTSPSDSVSHVSSSRPAGVPAPFPGFASQQTSASITLVGLSHATNFDSSTPHGTNSVLTLPLDRRSLGDSLRKRGNYPGCRCVGASNSVAIGCLECTISHMFHFSRFHISRQ